MAHAIIYGASVQLTIIIDVNRVKGIILTSNDVKFLDDQSSIDVDLRKLTLMLLIQKYGQ